MRSKAYILQKFCIIDSMKLYNQGFPFLYNTFYQGGPKILPGGGPKFYTKCAAYPYYLFILYLDFKNLNTLMRYALVNTPEPFGQMKH
jgi:hypothetical protein